MKRSKVRAIPSLFFLILLFSIFVNLVYSDELLISPNKSSYGLGATIRAYGTLTLGGNPVTDGLVAVQVEDSQGELRFIRVAPTGTLPSPWKVRIVDFLSCDAQSNPTTIFTRGTLAHFIVTVKSLDPVIERRVTIALNLFDSVGFSVAVAYANFLLEPEGQFTFFTSMPIPDDAFVGQAICTASILTDLPKESGHPYCPEGLTDFTIVDGASQTAGSSSALLVSSSDGSFNVSFKLPSTARLGNYAIYASARWNAWGSAAFDYFWLFTDIDRNGVVNVQDLFVIAKAYGSKLGDPRWNPKADLNSDDQVNIGDVYKVARDYGKARA